MENRPNSKRGKTTKTNTSKTVKFNRQFDPNYTLPIGEDTSQKSQTVPDMSLTVKELLLNHSRGIHSDIKHYEAQYFETEIPKFDDITEQIEYKEKLAEEIKAAEKLTKDELRAKAITLKELKEKKAAKAAREKKLAEIELKTNQEVTE